MYEICIVMKNESDLQNQRGLQTNIMISMHQNLFNIFIIYIKTALNSRRCGNLKLNVSEIYRIEKLFLASFPWKLEELITSMINYLLNNKT